MEKLFGSRLPYTDGISLSTEAAHLLTEVGFLAAAQGDVARAEVIFNALIGFRPLRAYPRIGLGVAWMNAGQPAFAATLMEAASLSDMERQERNLLDAWRGVALQQAGRTAESVRLLRQVAQSGTDAATMANALLGVTVKN